MIKNYIKTAWRSIWRDKKIAVISVGGLSLGIACFLLLGTYILNELRYDRFHLKADRIVRVSYNYKSPDDAEAQNNAVTPTAVVPVFKRNFSEIEDGVRVYNFAYKPLAVQFKERLFNEKSFLVADASFFKIFSFKFLSGNPATALSNPNNLVITASTAKKYFGDIDPIGKTITVDQTPWQVTGVIADVPPYSQLKFDFLGSYSSLERSKTEKWDSANDVSYFLLKSAGQARELQKKMNTYIQNQFPEMFKSGQKVWFELEPLTRVHLYSKAAATGNIKYIYIISAIAILLLLIACINFINLITAKSAERAHEIGVRKVLGAERKQIFLQFMAESAIVTLIAIGLGLLLSGVCLPYFNKFTTSDLSIKTWNSTWLISILAALFLLITLISGTWPALVLSAFRPVKALKGSSKISSGGNLRSALVVFQFTVSIAFIIATIIAGRQLYFIQHTHTGIDRSQIIVLDAGISNEQFEPLKNELLKISGIKSVTASYDSPVNVQGGYSLNVQEKSPDFSLSVTAIPVEKSFASTLGIEILAGSNFTQSDVSQVLAKDENERRYAFMLNQTAVSALGWTPEQAIGKKVNLNGRIGEIRAVSEDFNFASLHEKISPIVVFPEYFWFGKILIKTSGQDMQKTIAGTEKAWKSVFNHKDFEYHFLDQEYEDLYKTDQRTASILNLFSIITILVSCLGLFGLAVFMAEQRTKEIGIRKVLGASVSSIAALLSMDFLKLIVVAFLIASPLAWLVMQKWLQDFAYKTSISWWIFALAGLSTVFIALFTISFQAIKAALANPVKSLRSE